MAKKKKAKKPKDGATTSTAQRSWQAISTLIDTPLGREILADVLVAAATAAAAALTRHRPSAQQVAHAGEAAVETGARMASGTSHLAQVAAGALAEIMTEAARSILPSSLTGAETQEKAGAGKDPAKPPAGSGEPKGEDLSSRH